MFITFYVPEPGTSGDEVIPVAYGQTMTECANNTIPDNLPKSPLWGVKPSFRAFREIVADQDIDDMPVITLDEGILAIRNGWAFFTPIRPIPVNTDVYDN